MKKMIFTALSCLFAFSCFAEIDCQFTDTFYQVSAEDIVVTDQGIFINIEGAYVGIEGLFSTDNGLYACKPFERRVFGCLKCGRRHDLKNPCPQDRVR